jgi:ABC-type polysaccharide/polyol phosphate transport system ATPase subunit
LRATISPGETARGELLAEAPAAVRVERLSKTFQLPRQQFSTFKERALHPLKARTFDPLHAIDDVTFSVAQGEFFGIVGRNGSGKSTLLKCLAGIYKPDAGEARISGRLSPFIELGVGFNPDLTARDNVIINAIMLGLTRKQAHERFDEIIAFAELEEFLDLKLKNYSSGMSVRLAFSVAIQVDADVLLVDEVLAVGDAAFQQKCFQQFHRMKDEGRTIVFVTHDMSSVERFCDRAMLLERGRVVSIDQPHAIARAYNELNFGRLVAPGEGGDDEGDRYGDHQSAEIKDAWFETAAGERVQALAQGEPLRMCMEVAFHRAVDDPVFAAHLRNEVRHTVFATSSQFEHPHTGRHEAGTSVVVRVALDNWLATGRYEYTPTVARDGGVDVLDLREDLASLMVHGTSRSGGIVEIPHTIDISQA